MYETFYEVFNVLADAVFGGIDPVVDAMKDALGIFASPLGAVEGVVDSLEYWMDH